MTRALGNCAQGQKNRHLGKWPQNAVRGGSVPLSRVRVIWQFHRQRADGRGLGSDFLMGRCPYFKRKLLVTTVTLESAMAAEASMGESRPSAATGMPTTL
jgi:hypothetical protein